MHKLLTLLLLIVFIPSFGQDEVVKAMTDENYNFKIIDGNVAWQFVYKTDKTADEIRQYFERSRIFDIINSDSLSVQGRVSNRTVDYKKYGFSTGFVPMYIIGSPCSYDVDVNIKDKKYQVIIFNAVFNPAIRTSMMIGGNRQMTLNEAAYNFNRNKFKDAFGGAAAILATVWYDTYLIKATQNTSDDW